MRRLQELKPELDEIRAGHKDDPEKQQEEIKKLSREQGANPLGGLPAVLVQLPIFLALYYTITDFGGLEGVKSGACFGSGTSPVPDPYYILPVVYTLTIMAARRERR